MRFLIAVAVAALAQAQPLTVREAARLAAENHPAAQAARTKVKMAQARVEQASTGNLPRASYRESFQTSNNPVFAFGTLLNQRRFSQANFAIDKLNGPGFVNNFQSQISAEQNLWDAGATKLARDAARLDVKMNSEEERSVRSGRIAHAVRSYYAAVLAAEAAEVTKTAVKSAEADLARAEAVRAAGMSTDADVLAVRVHLASMLEQEINRAADAKVAKAALNEAIGLALDDQRDLVSRLIPATAPMPAEGGAERAEIRQAAIHRSLAQTQVSRARAELFPVVKLRGMFEADRGRFVTQAGANWWMGVSLDWNIFNGGLTGKKIKEASLGVTLAQEQEKQVASAVALQIRRARTQVDAAGERLKVAEAAVTHAEENLRIMKDRYEAGLTTVSDLLRSETALVDTRMRRLMAIHDQRIAAVELEAAKGTLTGESDVLE